MSVYSKLHYILGPANESDTALNGIGQATRKIAGDAVDRIASATAPSISKSKGNEHDFSPKESGPERGTKVSRAAANEGELTNDYKQQNIIGRDIQPIDPEFHVYRLINWLAIKTHPDMAAADVIRLSGGKIGQQQAWQLIQDVIKSKGGRSCDLNLSPSTYYNDLESISPYEPNTLVALSLATGKSSYASTPNTPLKDLAPYQTNLSDYMKNRQYKYECRLFNFYADNNKYFSAQFTLTGRIGMEYGKRIVWFDERRRYAWEGYLTGVSHDFRYDANGTGWTTTITVERMLPFTFDEARTLLTEQNTGMLWRRDMDSYRTVSGGEQDVTSEPIKGNFNKRFNMMWGHAEPFVGGFFGEQTLASMISQANSREQAYMTKFTGGGSSSGGSKSSGASSDDIVAYAKSQIGKHPYLSPPPSSSLNISGAEKSGSKMDCATFSWACVKHCGYNAPEHGWEGSRDLSHWCKQVSAKDAKAGDIITTPDHHLVMAGNYQGGNTDVVNEGGDRYSKYHGQNVQEGKLSIQIDTSMSENDYWEPQK